MLKYAIRRILLMIPVIIGVSFLIYFVMDLAPGDVISVTAGDQNLTTEQVAELRASYGLDQSVFVRYFLYMKNFLRGDLGTSYITHKPVLQTFMEKFPATLMLTMASMIVAIIISIPLGIYSALNRGTYKDNAALILALLGQSIPGFWLGLMLIIVFSLNLHWLPSGGIGGIKNIILPALTIGTGLTAILARTTRSSMLDVLRQDYLQTARAKGVPEKKVILKHALRNALIPIITIAGGQFAYCLGGSVLTETVFAWPGVGRLIVDSLSSRDTVMVTGCIILKSTVIGFILLFVDLLYAVIDPRIKAQFAKGYKR
ncbi:MAG: ABC transporter permease [Spirochaetes bacterium]|nr:ABC transporter permease [Spirochaetota bacterium]